MAKDEKKQQIFVKVYDKSKKRDIAPLPLMSWRTIQGDKIGKTDEFRYAAKGCCVKNSEGGFDDLEDREAKQWLESVKPTVKEKTPVGKKK